MSKTFKCGDCGHISRLSKRQIKHKKNCKRLRAARPAKRDPRLGAPLYAIKFAEGPPLKSLLIDREQFIAKLLSIKGDKTLHAFAPDLGVSYQFLGHVIKGDYPVGPKIAEALGYEQIVMFRPGKKPARVPKIDKRQMKLPILEKANAAASN